MNNSKAIWGTVSANGGLWTLHLPREGSSCNITYQGYGPDVFDGWSGPVVRFDKAPIESVLKAIAGPPLAVKGWSSPSDRPIMTLDEYLQHHRDHGVPVEEWE